MSRPLGFSMSHAVLERTRMCDVCTNTEASGWLETFVAGIPQSDLCLDCARDATALVEIPFSESLLACDDCPREFKTAAALGSHRRTHKIPVGDRAAVAV